MHRKMKVAVLLLLLVTGGVSVVVALSMRGPVEREVTPPTEEPQEPLLPGPSPSAPVVRPPGGGPFNMTVPPLDRSFHCLKGNFTGSYPYDLAVNQGSSTVFTFCVKPLEDLTRPLKLSFKLFVIDLKACEVFSDREFSGDDIVKPMEAMEDVTISVTPKEAILNPRSILTITVRIDVAEDAPDSAYWVQVEYLPAGYHTWSHIPFNLIVGKGLEPPTCRD